MSTSSLSIAAPVPQDQSNQSVIVYILAALAFGILLLSAILVYFAYTKYRGPPVAEEVQLDIPRSPHRSKNAIDGSRKHEKSKGTRSSTKDSSSNIVQKEKSAGIRSATKDSNNSLDSIRADSKSNLLPTDQQRGDTVVLPVSGSEGIIKRSHTTGANVSNNKANNTGLSKAHDDNKYLHDLQRSKSNLYRSKSTNIRQLEVPVSIKRSDEAPTPLAPPTSPQIENLNDYMLNNKESSVQNSSLQADKTDKNRSKTSNSSSNAFYTSETAQSFEKEVSLPGYLLGKFGIDYETIGDPLYSGSNAAVYKSHIISEDIKGRSVTDIDDTSFPREMIDASFIQEVSITWYFRDHPHFVKMYGYSNFPKSILLKFYSIGSLRDFVHNKTKSNLVTPQNGEYTFNLAIRLLGDVATGLSAMHQAGMVHNDIKPQNILLDINAHMELYALITDFGICRVLEKKNTVKGMILSKLEGISLAYAAPEVIERSVLRVREDDPKILKAGDTYAYFMLMYEVICRRTPWRGTTNIAERVIQGERPPLSPQLTFFPAHFAIGLVIGIIRSGWVQDPLQRPDFIHFAPTVLNIAGEL